MVKQSSISKGYKMEELLRGYFLKAGYYVARGVPFVYEGFDVTDVDIWLYGRASSVSREITIVDAKNKKTPQAIERIFWTQGLKIATGATNAVVATTDKRPEVRDFGRGMGVLVLDGTFLSKLEKSISGDSQRFSEEEFLSRIDEYILGKLDGDWRGRMYHCKSLLAKGLSFDGCNEWLLHARFFAEQALTKPNQQITALRCFYLICSYIAIAIDFALREVSFLDPLERSTLITDGFTYGSKGSAGMKKILDVAMGLVEQNAGDGRAIASQVRSSVERQLAGMNTAILGEYFSKNDVSKSLFSVAKEFENLAMQREFSMHASASTELRSMLYCFLDFWQIERVQFSSLLDKS